MKKKINKITNKSYNLKKSYRPRVRVRGNSDSKRKSNRTKMSPCEIVCSCKSIFVRFYVCEILSPRAKVSSCKIVFVQKYLCAILCTRAIFYARKSLTATQ